MINQAVLLCEGDTITIDGLKTSVFSSEGQQFPQPDITGIRSLRETVKRISDQVDNHVVTCMLDRSSYNKYRTARESVITRKTLTCKIEKYNIPVTNGTSTAELPDVGLP